MRELEDMGLGIRSFQSALSERREQYYPQCSDWSDSDWYMAVQGELGEAANFLKKVKRGDCELDDVRVDIAYELADTVSYIALLAQHLDIDLSSACADKFNLVSERLSCHHLSFPPACVRPDSSVTQSTPFETITHITDVDGLGYPCNTTMRVCSSVGQLIEYLTSRVCPGDCVILLYGKVVYNGSDLTVSQGEPYKLDSVILGSQELTDMLDGN